MKTKIYNIYNSLRLHAILIYYKKLVYSDYSAPPHLIHSRVRFNPVDLSPRLFDHISVCPVSQTAA